MTHNTYHAKASVVLNAAVWIELPQKLKCRIIQSNRPSVSNGSGQPASAAGLERINGSVQFRNHPKTWTAPSWGANPTPVSVHQRVSLGLPWSDGYNLRFSFLGSSFYGHVQQSYCDVENINFGTSLSFLDFLTAIKIKISREMLPATSGIWVWTIFCLASLVTFEVQHSLLDS